MGKLKFREKRSAFFGISPLHFDMHHFAPSTSSTVCAIFIAYWTSGFRAFLPLLNIHSAINSFFGYFLFYHFNLVSILLLCFFHCLLHQALCRSHAYIRLPLFYFFSLYIVSLAITRQLPLILRLSFFFTISCRQNLKEIKFDGFL